MRKTATSLLVLTLLGAGVLVATPAFASFGVVVEPPLGVVYSPSAGPATVMFTFAADDSATVFTVRIRRPGHGTIKEKDYLIDPATQFSPHPVSFTWKDLSVAAPTGYVIDVRRQSGGPVITSEKFTLRPALVSTLSANPSPFYPLVQDGYKDHTTIGFSLAADTTDTVVHVFADDAYGRCCGTEIRTEDLGPLASGAHTWAWDGAEGDASPAPKGTYFAKVEATDTNAVSVVSKALKVEVTKGTIRLTATKEKVGSAYARVADEHGTRRGGDCIVGRNAASHEVKILCANAAISVEWDWALDPGERIESVSFTIDGGYYGCHRAVDHTKSRSILLVHAPPTSTCDVTAAKIRYSYPVAA